MTLGEVGEDGAYFSQATSIGKFEDGHALQRIDASERIAQLFARVQVDEH
jgi:hypothetical protein